MVHGGRPNVRKHIESHGRQFRAAVSSTLAGQQIRGPITVNSAGITTVRTMNVSSGMPSPTMTPSWVSTIKGRTPSTQNTAARTMPALVIPDRLSTSRARCRGYRPRAFLPEPWSQERSCSQHPGRRGTRTRTTESCCPGPVYPTGAHRPSRRGQAPIARRYAESLSARIALACRRSVEPAISRPCGSAAAALRGRAPAARRCGAGSHRRR
jgi:hypothetical protein